MQRSLPYISDVHKSAQYNLYLNHLRSVGMLQDGEATRRYLIWSDQSDLIVERPSATTSRMARASVEGLLLYLSVQKIARMRYRNKLFLWTAKFGLEENGSLSGLTRFTSGRMDFPIEIS